MKIRSLSLPAAANVLRSFDIEPLFIGHTMSGHSNKYQWQICYYGNIAGYDISYAVRVDDLHGKMLTRFNINR